MSSSVQSLSHVQLFATPWTPCPSPTPRVYSNSCPLSRWFHPIISSSVIPFSACLSVVIQLLSHVLLCDPMGCSTPGPVHHHLPEFAQTHVHWVGDAIQSSHLLSPLLLLPSLFPSIHPSIHLCVYIIWLSLWEVLAYMWHCFLFEIIQSLPPHKGPEVENHGPNIPGMKWDYPYKSPKSFDSGKVKIKLK